MNKKVGRPEYEPTAADRKRVSIAAAGGMSHAEVAVALGISRNTLEKYFAIELTTGAMERRAEVLAALFKVAKKGSASAAKAFLGGAAGPGKGGKKEQANAEAAGAQTGTEWDELLPRPGAVQ